MPWRDRTGAVSPLRLGVLGMLLAPGLWLAAISATEGLGPEPWDSLIGHTGDFAIWALLLALAVTPLRQLLRQARLATIRRMVGLGALAWLAAHVLIYALDQGSLWRVASEIVLRFYLTLGFLALLAMAALGATSTDAAVKRLGGRAWRRLHRLVFPAAVLAVAHVTLQSKTDVSEPMLYAGLLAWLLAYRVVAPEGGAPGLATLLALAIGAAAATAAGEALWYGLATGINGWLVFWANFDPEMEPRPAAWVLAAGLAALALRALPSRRAARRAATDGGRPDGGQAMRMSRSPSAARSMPSSVTCTSAAPSRQDSRASPAAVSSMVT